MWTCSVQFTIRLEIIIQHRDGAAKIIIIMMVEKEIIITPLTRCVKVSHYIVVDRNEDCLCYIIHITIATNLSVITIILYVW